MQERNYQPKYKLSELDNKVIELLKEPEYSFLNTPKHIDAIAVMEERGALQYIRDKSKERAERTFRAIGTSESIILSEIDPTAVHELFSAIQENSEKIGEGGDANVLIKTTPDFLHISSREICYKYLKESKVVRGRNDLFDELRMQEIVYNLLKDNKHLKVAAPVPYFATEVGGYKVIGMERLRACTIGEIKRGIGSIPSWVNIDELRQKISETIEFLHSHGIYHRDLHENNVMIPQTETPQDMLCYFIDFGLSAKIPSGIEPYKNYIAGDNLTYKDDHAILIWMNGLRRENL